MHPPYPSTFSALRGTVSRIALMTGLVAVAMAPMIREVAAQAGETAPVELPTISVEGQASGGGYKVDESASPKFTAPLLETPKSVTIIPQEVIEERGATSLREVLRTVPGITMGAGEGGTAFGDRPFIRGFEARTDIMIDGLRDFGTFSREVFNLEAVEITKGPGSAYTGRGSTGGSLNLVSKMPRPENFAAGSLTVGTDLTKRATVDGNYMISDSAALRINLMGHDAEVAGRDVVELQRWGIAPSLTLGFGTPTRATFSFYHLQTDDIPDFGHPFDPATGKPVKVDRSNFYGFAERDFSKTQADIGTLTLEHDLSDRFTLRSSTRYGWSEQDYIVTRPSFNTGTGQVNRDGRSRNADHEVLINQTDLLGRLSTGSIQHDFIAGIEVSREKLRNRGYTTPASPQADLHNPNPHDPFGQPITVAGGVSNPVIQTTRAAYVFDTAKITPQWDLNLGLRLDDYSAESGDVRNNSTFLNYQVGLVYKPLPYGSVYFAYGTSSQPAGEGAGQSGGQSDLVGLDTLDPEKSRSYEIGTKWDVLDRKLSLTAAVFRTEKTNVRVSVAPGVTELAGDSRVDGLEIGFAGNVTHALKVFGGYSYLRSKIVDDGIGTNDGNEFPNVAPHAFSLWSTYEVTRDWVVGGGAYYMGRRYVNTQNTLKLPPYWRFDAMAQYRVMDGFELQLNLLNLTNETIYDASHVGLFANVAPGRTALLTANVKF